MASDLENGAATETDDLRADLVAAFRGDSASEPENDAPQEPEQAAAEVVEEPAAEAEQAADDPGEALEEDAEAPADVAIPAPEHWSATDKEKFAALPDDATRQWFLDTRKQIERGAQEKFDQAAEARRLHDEVTNLCKPYETQLRQYGLTTTDAVRRLFAADQLLREDPAAGLETLAKQYVRLAAGTGQAQEIVQRVAAALGVNVGAPTNGAGQAELTPEQAEIDALKTRLAAIEQSGENARLAQDQAMIEAAAAKLTSFADAKDEAGNPKHPHFQRVREHMGLIMQAASAAKAEAPTLEQAYERAVWADDELRAERIDADRRAAALRSAEQRRAHAAKAALAKTPRTTSVAADAPIDQPLRDDLTAAYRESVSRAGL